MRVWVTEAVQWGPARNSIKYGVHVAALGRARVLRARGTMPEVANIFTGSCPRSGSQWAKALFDHPIVRAHTGLFTLPQLGYADGRLPGFPGGTFVPGLYISYDRYRAMRKPFPHRMVYVFRDPREILVSAYGAVSTHRRLSNANQIERALDGKSVDDQLLWLLKNGEGHLRDMATWVGAAEEDETVASWRLEDIAADPASAVAGMLDHCGVHLSPSEMETLLAETSRAALQRRDLAAREPGSESHYRVHQQGYEDLLKPEHYAAIEKVVPGFIEKMGYPPLVY
ncbi:MAG TPA: sulfotransferase domain-containing protein [Acidimicrobiales bacterium]